MRTYRIGQAPSYCNPQHQIALEYLLISQYHRERSATPGHAWYCEHGKYLLRMTCQFPDGQDKFLRLEFLLRESNDCWSQSLLQHQVYLGPVKELSHRRMARWIYRNNRYVCISNVAEKTHEGLSCVFVPSVLIESNYQGLPHWISVRRDSIQQLQNVVGVRVIVIYDQDTKGFHRLIKVLLNVRVPIIWRV